MRHWRLPPASSGSNVCRVFQRVHIHVEVERRGSGRVVSRGRVGVLAMGIVAILLLLLLLLRMQGRGCERAEICTGDCVLGDGLEG